MLTYPNGQLFYVNRAWQELYGYSWDEAIGNTPAMLRSRQQNPNFYLQMWASILDTEKRHWKGELVNQAKNGSEVPVFLTITPILDEDGKTQGYMGIGVDISEKKQMEEQMLRSDRLASIGIVAAGLAHEIGNPLSVIRGRAEYMALQPPTLTQVAKNAEIIIAQTDRISELIYSLLHLAKGEDSEGRSLISFHSAVRTVLEWLNVELKKKSIAVEIHSLENVMVFGEESKLEQVVLNLLLNSIHAIDSVTHNFPDREHRIFIQAFDRNKSWEIRFCDTGCGISEENQKHLFQPFFTTKGAGTGLGLTICDKIIRSWGGHIDVQSRVDEQTCFNIFLPKAPTGSLN